LKNHTKPFIAKIAKDGSVSLLFQSVPLLGTESQFLTNARACRLVSGMIPCRSLAPGARDQNVLARRAVGPLRVPFPK
jgi:hypothetical protein